jgi:hypothetical protein
MRRQKFIEKEFFETRRLSWKKLSNGAFPVSRFVFRIESVDWVRSAMLVVGGKPVGGFFRMAKFAIPVATCDRL